MVLQRGVPVAGVEAAQKAMSCATESAGSTKGGRIESRRVMGDTRFQLMSSSLRKRILLYKTKQCK
jgi:hypothetical protein